MARIRGVIRDLERLERRQDRRLRAEGLAPLQTVRPRHIEAARKRRQRRAGTA